MDVKVQPQLTSGLCAYLQLVTQHVDLFELSLCTMTSIAINVSVS